MLEEGDGRCVHASLPNSIKHSTLNLLLNPPSIFSFIIISVILFKKECSPFHPNL